MKKALNKNDQDQDLKKAKKKASPQDHSQTQKNAMPPMEDWFKAYSKNIDALTQASRMSAEVFQGLSRLQSEYMKQMMQDLNHISQDLMKPGDVKDKLNQHSLKAREGMDKTTDHAKKISKAIQDNAHNVSQIMHKRIKEAMQENHQYFDGMRHKTQKHEMMKHWSQWLKAPNPTQN